MKWFKLVFLLMLLEATHIGCVTGDGYSRIPKCAEILADFHNANKDNSTLPPDLKPREGLIVYPFFNETAWTVEALCFSPISNNPANIGCKRLGDMTQVCRATTKDELYYSIAHFEKTELGVKIQQKKPTVEEIN